MRAARAQERDSRDVSWKDRRGTGWPHPRAKGRRLGRAGRAQCYWRFPDKALLQWGGGRMGVGVCEIDSFP